MTDWLAHRDLPDAATERGSFLFLAGIILNQNISGELAWLGVKRLSRRVDMDPRHVSRRSADELEVILRRSPVIHPFTATMALAITEAAVVVRDHYQGDTRRLWREAAGAADVIVRLTRFRQIGQHKAEVAMFLLAEVYGETDAGSGIDIEERCPALLSYLS
jgi:uncharacterized HhH-GPD family protein